MARIGEVFGTRVDIEAPSTPALTWLQKDCPFTGGMCDVTGNRSNMSYLVPPKSASDDEKEHFRSTYGDYGKPHYPFSICSVTSQRRSADSPHPWIVCPKRLLDLRPAATSVPPEIRNLMPDVQPGQTVRVWWEVKFTHKELGGTRQFEYTFDFLMVPITQTPLGPRFFGAPYAIEIMTASTRGGGLTEHLWDVLQCRPQRPLGGVVDSAYTPNYRQVFGRMVSQFFVKCEALAEWGGRAMWLIQDELLEYIEESTDFDRKNFVGQDGAGTFLVYQMQDVGERYALNYVETVTGPTRPQKEVGQPYMTDMVGAGYVPPLAALEQMLLVRPRNRSSGNWRDLIW